MAVRQELYPPSLVPALPGRGTPDAYAYGHGHSSQAIYGSGGNSIDVEIIPFRFPTHPHDSDGFSDYTAGPGPGRLGHGLGQHLPLPLHPQESEVLTSNSVRPYTFSLPRLQIPAPPADSPSPPSASPLVIQSAATTTGPRAKFHPPPSLARTGTRLSSRGSAPLSAPDDFRYHPLYEVPQGTVSMLASSSTASTSASGAASGSGAGGGTSAKRKARSSPTSDDNERDAAGENDNDNESGRRSASPSAAKRARSSPASVSTPASPSGSASPRTTRTSPLRRTTTTAVIACKQCRTRKIRCDSTRPHCANCARRGDAATCEYDPAPKRRGPDKRPGTRTRRCKKRAGEESDDAAAGDSVSTGRNEGEAKTGNIERGTISLPAPAPMHGRGYVGGGAGRPIRPLPSTSGGPGPTTTSMRLRIDTDVGLGMGDAGIRSSGRPASASTLPSSRYDTPSTAGFTSYDYELHGPLSASASSPYATRSAGYDLGVGLGSALMGPGSNMVTNAGINMVGSVLGPGEHPKFPGLPSTAAQAAQQGWWDAFLRSYPVRDIAHELEFLYGDSASTLSPGAPALAFSFVNPRFLVDTLFHPKRRLTLQPAFILASMALAVLVKSSDAGGSGSGAQGRERAAFLRQSAQDALERAWKDGGGTSAGVGWVDASLAEAALLITQYEASAHPEYNPERLARALGFLDEVLSALDLTALDTARSDVCRFARGAAPIVPVPASSSSYPASSSSHFSAPEHHEQPTPTCNCLPPGTPPPAARLPWDPAWGVRALRDEECRRLVWAALSLVTSFRAECWAMGRVDLCAELRMCNPANYAVLFPNELYDRGPGLGINAHDTQTSIGTHPKNTIWALYCRSMLLANFCSNVVGVASSSSQDHTLEQVRRGSGIGLDMDEQERRETQAEALHEAWNEAQAVQDALDAHVCNLHRAVAYLCRENVYNSHMVITRGFRNLQGLPSGNRSGPVFNRRQAEEWIYYQSTVIKDVTLSVQYLSDARGHQLTQRPFAVPWFTNQLAICLQLWEGWENDGVLGGALELAKEILVPLDVMNALWPCELIQLQCAALRERLAAHCRAAGREPPAPAPSHIVGAILNSRRGS